MSRPLAARMSRLSPSASISIAERVQELRRAGKEILDLSWGEPDFPTPAHVVEAGRRALAEGATKYTASAGILPLREAIAEHLQATRGVAYDPKTEIVVTPGGKQALLDALLALVDAGDDVLVPEPAWLSYADCTAIAGARYVGVPSVFEDGFKPRPEAWRAALTPRTRVIVVNTPANPTGAVWQRAELEEVAALAREHDLTVLTDEIYDAIVFDGQEHVSIASLEGMRERTLLIGGFSKSYAMTGWRLGWIAGPAALVRAVSVIHQHSSTCAAAVSQAAGVAALRGPQDAVAAMRAEYQRRRDVVVDGFNAIEGLRCFRPAGTFYGFIDARAMAPTSVEAARLWLEEARVAALPGAAYGQSGEGYIRISFATSMETLRRAIDGVARIGRHADAT
jgi:aspartate aminotransferase